jgi:hypothetical protein
MWTNSDVIQHLLQLLVCLYGTSLFIYWWIKVKKVSPIFVYLTALLLGLTMAAGSELYAEHLRLCTTIDYRNEWHWVGRKHLQLTVVLFIVVHMSYRLFIEKVSSERRKWKDRRIEQKNRRNSRNDRREENGNRGPR